MEDRILAGQASLSALSNGSHGARLLRMDFPRGDGPDGYVTEFRFDGTDGGAYTYRNGDEGKQLAQRRMDEQDHRTQYFEQGSHSIKEQSWA